MPQRLNAALACLLAVPAIAQAASQSRDLVGFRTIQVGDGVSLEVELGARFAVVVSSNRSALQQLVTNLEDSRLEIQLRTHEGSADHRAEGYRVHVTLPAITQIVAGNGSDVVVKGLVTGQDLRLVASGAASVRLHASVDDLKAEATGGSLIKITGKASRFRAQAHGGSRVDAAELVAEIADAEAGGGGTIHVNAAREVSGSARGGGDIHVIGTAQRRFLKASGGSNIFLP